MLIVGPAWPLRGGLATYNERLCREFNQNGHHCEILSFSLQYPSLLFPGKSQYSSDAKPKDLIIYSNINSINPFNWIKNGLIFKNNNYDIVIFRYWLSFMAPAFGTIARLLKLNKLTKIIAITDNIIPHEKRFLDSLFTSFFIKSCDGFLSMSQEVYQQVNTLQPNKPKVYAPHPMYDMFGEQTDKKIAKIKLGLNPNVNYILFFGFIRKYKGLSLLLDSFAACNYLNNNLKLIVAGEFYEDSAPYLQQIEKLNLTDHVVLKTDFIPNNQVALYFSAADMVVQTYLNATQSGVTQIAYFYNKPMLVTNVGGLAELIPHNVVGYICSKNPTEIASCINDFYLNQKAVLFENNIKTEKQKFTWKYLTDKIINLV